MPVVEESVYIPRPPQDVFNFVSDFGNVPVWDSSVVHAEMVGEGPVRLGSRARGTTKILGKKFDWEAEITEFQPPGRVVIRSVDGDLEFTITNTFQPEGDGTRFTFRVDAATGLGGIFGKLADRFVETAQARTVRANLETLSELLAEHPEYGQNPV